MGKVNGDDRRSYQVFPDLAPDEFETLKRDIAERGVQVAIEMTPEGEILDGHQRLRVCQELGIRNYPRRIVGGLDDQGKRHHAIKANCLRRHLTRQQRRELIAGELRGNPRQSNRLLAELVGVDKNTVQSIRDQLVAGGEIHHVGARDGKDGKIYRRISEGSIAAYKDEQEDQDEEERPDRRTYYNFRLGKLRPRASDHETPPGLARFLFETISSTYEVHTILDPCAGKGAMTKPWRGRQVVAFEIAKRKDFFLCSSRIECDLVLCNPPFSQDAECVTGYQPEQFLRRIVEVVPRRTPIVLITPMGMRLHQEKRSKRWRWLRDEAPAITSIISLPRDVFPSVDYHVEILLFNMPRLKPHYFLPDRYL
jgi:hypothetical protein